MRRIFNYFTRAELILWCSSAAVILISFFIFDRASYLTLAASLVGVTSLIFGAKGHPVGMLLMIIFSLLYGIISYTFSYYGEMITYLGMTMPMSLLSLISWLKNPYEKGKAEVKVDKLKPNEGWLMLLLSAAVTALFYFILSWLGTANIVPATVSVTTSFLAVYLTFRRSPYFALAYAANDIVLIVLWVLASISDIRYVSVIVCFGAFLVSDLYAFFSWRKMAKRQENTQSVPRS